MQTCWQQLPFEQRMNVTYEDFQKYHRLLGRMLLFLEAHPEEQSPTFLLDPGISPLVAELAKREVEAQTGLSVRLVPAAPQEPPAHTVPPRRPPTFHERRIEHDISLEQLVADAQLAPWVVEQVDTTGTADAHSIDLLLASLSRLSGTVYRRNLFNVSGFTFTLPAAHEPTRAPAQKEES